MPLDSLVDTVTTYRQRPLWAHVYAGPFLVIYTIWFYVWYSIYGFDDYYELGCIGMGVIGILQALVILFGHWFVGVKCALSCVYEKDPNKATFVKVVPTPNNGWAELVQLERSKLGEHSKLWFEFQKVHYILDEDKKQFRTVLFDTHQPMSYYQQASGMESDQHLGTVKYTLGDNK
uniref:EbsA protein n=1 Tax=Heterorhabditis bacteriophora TaxID=37862 RepID=A0A1I7WN14_HETBA